MDSKILKISGLNIFYGDNRAVKDVSVEFEKNKVTAVMGPSGCGKTTLLRTINRLHELTPNVRTEGEIFLKDENILKLDPVMLRRKIGMVFQRPNPFPSMSIYQNVIAGYILNSIGKSKTELMEICRKALEDAGLWDEVKDKLHEKGTSLSGGQQQRLCIARSLAMKPEILLLDEPTSALDPASTRKIEELILELKKKTTIIIVTHNIAQAGRISDFTAFLYLGELVEFGKTEKVFTVPQHRRTNEYLTGKFG